MIKKCHVFAAAYKGAAMYWLEVARRHVGYHLVSGHNVWVL